MQGHYFFLNRSFTDQTIDGDRLGLAHAVRSIAGLILDGRVPPGIEVDDGIGLGQIQTRAPRLEADQKQRNLCLLEAAYCLLALFTAATAIEITVVQLGFFQPFAQQGEQIDKLTEHQQAMAVIDGVDNELHGGIEFTLALFPIG